MKKQTKLVAQVLVGCLLSVGAAQAGLINRGGGLIYDDVLNVTWLQNANPTAGVVNFHQAQEYVQTLEYYDSVRGVTWDDWRLPAMFVNDMTLDNWVISGELSYMYYNNLAYSPGYSLDRWTVPEPTSDAYNPFENLQYRSYWSDVTAWNPDRAWTVHYHFGWTGYTDAGDVGFVWAVRDGDVANSVPEPGSLALFGIGLVLVGAMRRKKGLAAKI